MLRRRREHLLLHHCSASALAWAVPGTALALCPPPSQAPGLGQTRGVPFSLFFFGILSEFFRGGATLGTRFKPPRARVSTPGVQIGRLGTRCDLAFQRNLPRGLVVHEFTVKEDKPPGADPLTREKKHPAGSRPPPIMDVFCDKIQLYVKKRFGPEQPGRGFPRLCTVRAYSLWISHLCGLNNHTPEQKWSPVRKVAGKLWNGGGNECDGTRSTPFSINLPRVIPFQAVPQSVDAVSCCGIIIFKFRRSVKDVAQCATCVRSASPVGSRLGRENLKRGGSSSGSVAGRPDAHRGSDASREMPPEVNDVILL
eukprot:gene6335-biopygen19376